MYRACTRYIVLQINNVHFKQILHVRISNKINYNEMNNLKLSFSAKLNKRMKFILYNIETIYTMKKTKASKHIYVYKLCLRGKYSSLVTCISNVVVYMYTGTGKVQNIHVQSVYMFLNVSRFNDSCDLVLEK